MQLTQAGNQVTQCEEDADIVIVKQALEIAATKPVTVLADDINAFVILIHHLENSISNIYFSSDKAV